ncbi:hypothetical protein [Hydrogenimonas sp.]
MCESLKTLIETDLRPFVLSAKAVYAREGDFDRERDLENLLETFEEIVADIEAGTMDAWECGELHDEFKRHRESGDFLDRIT